MFQHPNMQRSTQHVTDQETHAYNRHDSERTLNCVTQFTDTTKSNKLYTQMDDLLVSNQFTQRIEEGSLGYFSLKLVEAEEAKVQTRVDTKAGEAGKQTGTDADHELQFTMALVFFSWSPCSSSSSSCLSCCSWCSCCSWWLVERCGGQKWSGGWNGPGGGLGGGFIHFFPFGGEVCELVEREASPLLPQLTVHMGCFTFFTFLPFEPFLLPKLISSTFACSNLFKLSLLISFESPSDSTWMALLQVLG